MFNITPTRRYLKKALKLIKKNPNLEVKIDNFINQLADNPKYPSLKSHQIDHSDYGKIWSSWLHDDLRIFWRYEGENIVILLLDIGSHDEVY